MPSAFASAPLELQPLAQAQPFAASDYKRCACLGKSPLRACRFCSCVGWLKICPTCLSQGTLTKPGRQANAQGRTERCGFCMGAGWVPCPMGEKKLAEEAWGGEESVPAPAMPSPAATEKRIQTRRKTIEKSKKHPKSKTRLGTTSIAAERPQTPLEAMELADPEEVATEPVPAEVAPSSFAPDLDLPSTY